MKRTPPGLQAERTRLAWDRTGLAFAAYGGLLQHAGKLPGIAVILCGFTVVVLGRRRYRRAIGRLRRDEPLPPPRALAVVAVFATATVALSMAVALTSP